MKFNSEFGLIAKWTIGNLAVVKWWFFDFRVLDL